MHYLITGHTGFKGTWLTLLLKQRGHEVSGIALDPPPNSLFESAGVANQLKFDFRGDIRNYDSLEKKFSQANPDVIIHLAAQALVSESYKNPLYTFSTNVTGTINVLRASQVLNNLRAQLIITTDKVYRNTNKTSGYVESDALGGQDPYSASKAMADIATQSWLASFKNSPTAIARAGNVIGGGDVCVDRLVPDLVKSYSQGETPRLRSPNSIRPWQHVLDCLNGYLMLVNSLLEGNATGPWNFGPEIKQIRSVADLSEIASEAWGVNHIWELDSTEQFFESSVLLLNSNKARASLGWHDKLNFEESVRLTINWYKNVNMGESPLEETLKNIRAFESTHLFNK